jgi:hypothetical protein
VPAIEGRHPLPVVCGAGSDERIGKFQAMAAIRIRNAGWVNWTGLATLLATVEESVENHVSGIVSLF